MAVGSIASSPPVASNSAAKNPRKIYDQDPRRGAFGVGPLSLFRDRYQRPAKLPEAVHASLCLILFFGPLLNLFWGEGFPHLLTQFYLRFLFLGQFCPNLGDRLGSQPGQTFLNLCEKKEHTNGIHFAAGPCFRLPTNLQFSTPR